MGASCSERDAIRRTPANEPERRRAEIQPRAAQPAIQKRDPGEKGAMQLLRKSARKTGEISQPLPGKNRMPHFYPGRSFVTALGMINTILKDN